jgi:hypothetical protein
LARFCFLYSECLILPYPLGPAPSIEEPQGPYPTMVKQPSGKSVPVVQAFAFGKYLGNLMVTFNDEGEVIAAAGLPILMDKSIPQGSILCQAKFY